MKCHVSRTCLLLLCLAVLSGCQPTPRGGGSWASPRSGGGWIICAYRTNPPGPEKAYFVLITSMDCDSETLSSGTGDSSAGHGAVCRGLQKQGGKTLVEYSALAAAAQATINGKEYDLNQGAVFVVDDELQVRQMPWSYDGDPRAVAHDPVVLHLADRAALDTPGHKQPERAEPISP